MYSMGDVVPEERLPSADGGTRRVFVQPTHHKSDRVVTRSIHQQNPLAAMGVQHVNTRPYRHRGKLVAGWMYIPSQIIPSPSIIRP
jgi:hypothetical protein